MKNMLEQYEAAYKLGGMKEEVEVDRTVSGDIE